MAKSITTGTERNDTALAKRVELHLHTRMSAMDSVVDFQELFSILKRWGHDAVAVTDHGVVQAIPEFHEQAVKHGIKPVFGLEGQAYNDQLMEPSFPDGLESKGVLRFLYDKARSVGTRYRLAFHISMLAMNRAGLKNLYRLVSLSYTDYYHRGPKIPISVLLKHREGLLLGTSCISGELSAAYFAEASYEEMKEIAAFYDYIEIMPLDAFCLLQNVITWNCKVFFPEVAR